MPFTDRAAAWTAACRRAVKRQQALLAAPRDSADAESSIGAGGDISLEMDRRFEEIALEELKATIGPDAARTVIVNEEVGELGAESTDTRAWVILDPMDGSKNYAHGLPQFALSVAVAHGPTMADVHYAYIFNFGTCEEFVCEAAGGPPYLEVNSDPVAGPRHANGSGGLVAFESAEPALLVPGLQRLADAAFDEIRVTGAIAIALCDLSLGRVRGLVTCKQCRSVDAAAGQLIARASGATVLYDGEDGVKAPLALAARYRLVAGFPSLAPDLLAAQAAIPLVPR